jgi:hypothetical protein
MIASMIPRSQAQLNQAASDEDMSTTSKFRGRSSVEDARQEADGGAGKRYDSKTSLHGAGLVLPSLLVSHALTCSRPDLLSRSRALSQAILLTPSRSFVPQSGWSRI